jgi:hypothetical protein
MKVKYIFEKLVARASCWSLLSSTRRNPAYGKPGELIESLSDEDREELKKLSSDDSAEPDRSALNYMLGQYLESTVTVRTHSFKKEE